MQVAVSQLRLTICASKHVSVELFTMTWRIRGMREHCRRRAMTCCRSGKCFTHLPSDTCHGTVDALGSSMRNQASQYRWSLLWLSAYLWAAIPCWKAWVTIDCMLSKPQCTAGERQPASSKAAV